MSSTGLPRARISGRHLPLPHPRARASGIVATRPRAHQPCRRSRARLEFKGLSLTLHYRAVRPERWPDVEAIAPPVLAAAAILTAIQGHRIVDSCRGSAGTKARGALDGKAEARTAPNGPRRRALRRLRQPPTSRCSRRLRGKALTIRVGACPTGRPTTRSRRRGRPGAAAPDGQRARGLTPMARASRSGVHLHRLRRAAQTLDVHRSDERELGHRLQEVPAESISSTRRLLPPPPAGPRRLRQRLRGAGSPSSSGSRLTEAWPWSIRSRSRT